MEREFIVRVTGAIGQPPIHFCAGAIVRDGRFAIDFDGARKRRQIAPILVGVARSVDYHARGFVRVCRARGWQVEIY